MWSLQRSSLSLVRRVTRLPPTRARLARDFWKKGGASASEADGVEEGEVRTSALRMALADNAWVPSSNILRSDTRACARGR